PEGGGRAGAAVAGFPHGRIERGVSGRLPLRRVAVGIALKSHAFVLHIHGNRPINCRYPQGVPIPIRFPARCSSFREPAGPVLSAGTLSLRRRSAAGTKSEREGNEMRRAAMAMTLALLAATAITPAHAQEAIETEKAQIVVDRVSGELAKPWGLAFLPDG